MRIFFAILLCAFGAQTVFADPIRVALVLDKGGKDDKSFNSAAYRGATEAKEKLGVFLKTIEASDDTFFEPAMRSFIKKKFDLIIGIGVAQAETVQRLAKEFPDQKFMIIDAKVDGPSVYSATFAEHEGSYLVGYIAGLKSKSGHVGFIGGMDIPLIRRFEKAYAQGVKAAKASATVEVNYVGVTSDAWNNPTKGKELAQNQYQRGVDIIFVAAGASNFGVFDSAESMKKLAIGVDSNQNWMKPGFILTSMLKRIDLAVFQQIEALAQNRFKGGSHEGTVKDGLMGWALDQHNENLFTTEDLKKIEKIRLDLASGKTHPDDYYLKK